MKRIYQRWIVSEGNFFLQAWFVFKLRVLKWFQWRYQQRIVFIQMMRFPNEYFLAYTRRWCFANNYNFFSTIFNFKKNAGSVVVVEFMESVLYSFIRISVLYSDDKCPTCIHSVSFLFVRVLGMSNFCLFVGKLVGKKWRKKNRNAGNCANVAKGMY